MPITEPCTGECKALRDVPIHPLLATGHARAPWCVHSPRCDTAPCEAAAASASSPRLRLPQPASASMSETGRHPAGSGRRGRGAGARRGRRHWRCCSTAPPPSRYATRPGRIDMVQPRCCSHLSRRRTSRRSWPGLARPAGTVGRRHAAAAGCAARGPRRCPAGHAARRRGRRVVARPAAASARRPPRHRTGNRWTSCDHQSAEARRLAELLDLAQDFGRLARVGARRALAARAAGTATCTASGACPTATARPTSTPRRSRSSAEDRAA